jgi:DNA-binding CsgD family transcriptional regulator
MGTTGRERTYTMKLTAKKLGDEDVAQVPGVKIMSEFTLDGHDYYIVEENTAGTSSWLESLPEAIEVGHCEINGKTFRVMKRDVVLETDQELVEMLTERELEITALVALGWPNKQIADKLHISEWTVSTHIRRIFAKLGVHSRAAMVYRCTGLIGNGYSKA